MTASQHILTYPINSFPHTKYCHKFYSAIFDGHRFLILSDFIICDKINPRVSCRFLLVLSNIMQ